MAEAQDEVVSQGPRLEKKMACCPDREGDHVADHAHSCAPRDDTCNETTHFHDSRDRVQPAVDGVLVTPEILLTEGAKGFTHEIDLLGTGQRCYAGFAAVAGRPGRNILACWLLPLSRLVECNKVAHKMMFLRWMGRRIPLRILLSHNGFLNVGCEYAACSGFHSIGATQKCQTRSRNRSGCKGKRMSADCLWAAWTIGAVMADRPHDPSLGFARTEAEGLRLLTSRLTPTGRPPMRARASTSARRFSSRR